MTYLNQNTSVVHTKNLTDFTFKVPRSNQLITSRISRHGSINVVCPRFKRETEGGRSFSVPMNRILKLPPAKIKCIDTISSFKNTMLKFFKESYNEIEHFVI